MPTQTARVYIDPDRFRAACRAIDRPQAWVARQAGIRRQTLQNYLDGRALPIALVPRLTAATGRADFLRDAVQGEAAA